MAWTAKYGQTLLNRLIGNLHNAALLVVSGSVTRQFQYLSHEVYQVQSQLSDVKPRHRKEHTFQHSCEVDCAETCQT